MIPGQKFAFIVKYYVSVVLVAAISRTVFISAFIAWLQVSHVCYKIHVIGFCETAEAVKNR